MRAKGANGLGRFRVDLEIANNDDMALVRRGLLAADGFDFLDHALESGVVILEFRPQRLDHEAIDVAERDLLHVSQAAVGGEEIIAVSVIVSQDVADLAADGRHSAAVG